MTISLELTPEQEARLRQEVAQQGHHVADLVITTREEGSRIVIDFKVAGPEDMPFEEWMRRLKAPPPGPSALPAEALTRASMYEERT